MHILIRISDDWCMPSPYMVKSYPYIAITYHYITNAYPYIATYLNIIIYLPPMSYYKTFL